MAQRAHRARDLGYDWEWHAIAPLVRDTRYTNLPPGDYVLEVRGRNNSGTPGVSSAQLPFSIRPHFHETPLFKAMLVALALALVHAGYRYQRLRHARQRAVLESPVSERTADLEESNRRMRAGDVVLQQVAAVLTAMVRTGDYVVRWGGEEFLLVFRPMPMEQLAVLGERLRSAIAAHPFDIGDGKVLRLTASTGLAEYPLFRAGNGTSLGWEAMVELADQAMYHVKTHGRDGWAAYCPTPRTDVDKLLADLQQDAGALVADGRVELVGSAASHPVPS